MYLILIDALDCYFSQAEFLSGELWFLSLSLGEVSMGASRATFASQGYFALGEQKGVAMLNHSGSTWYS